jgi:hypothetical protein
VADRHQRLVWGAIEPIPEDIDILKQWVYETIG